MAVSYTHLDVYKRQVCVCVCVRAWVSQLTNAEVRNILRIYLIKEQRYQIYEYGGKHQTNGSTDFIKFSWKTSAENFSDKVWTEYIIRSRLKKYAYFYKIFLQVFFWLVYNFIYFMEYFCFLWSVSWNLVTEGIESYTILQCYESVCLITVRKLLTFRPKY